MPADRDVFAALTALVLERTATPEELERFRELLRGNPAFVEIYRRQILMATLLPALSAREEKNASESLGCGLSPGVPVRLHKSPRFWWDMAAAAAALLLVGGGVWWAGRPESPSSGGRGEEDAPFAAMAPYVPSSAWVSVETVASDNVDASELPAPGCRDYLSAIEMAGGSYTFRLEAGVTCVLLGPAKLTFKNDSRLVLHRGTLLAEVGHHVMEFYVETPMLRVRDLGTRFGVSVADSGATEVMVAKGRVLYEDAMGREVMPLTAGNGVKVGDAEHFRTVMASEALPQSLEAWQQTLSGKTNIPEESEMNAKTTSTSMGLAAVVSAAVLSLNAGDGVWSGTGTDALYYWDQANWQDGQIANGAGSAAYFTNSLNPKIVLTNDLTLGYLLVSCPVSSNAVTFEGGSLTVQGGAAAIRNDNRRVDFHTVMRGSGGFTKTGNQSFYPYRKSEMTGTNRVSQGTLGLDFRQDADSTNALALNHLNPEGLVLDTYGGQIRIGGRPSRTADQTGVFTLDAASRRAVRVSGVSVANLSAGQVVTAAGGVLSEGTYLKTVLDDNTFELSAAPLAAGDSTLTFKAASFNTVQEFNLLQIGASASLYVGLSGDSTLARIGMLAGGYGFYADGSATVEIQNTRDFGGVLALTNTVTLALTDQRAVPAVPATNAAFHVDASATNTMTLTTSGSDVLVGIWNDKNGTKVTGSSTTVRYAVSQGNRTNLKAPVFLANALNGLPVVDFGAAGSCRGMIWNDNIGGIRTVFMVVGSQEGGGILLGSKDGNTCSFERGMDVYASKGTYASKVYTTPLTKNHALFFDRTAQPLNNAAWLNGQPVDYQYTGLSGDYDVFSFVWNEDTTGGTASGFAMRGGMVSPYYPERSGGQRLAEVIVYQRALTDQERRDTEAYLYYKWFGKTLPGYGAPKINTLRAIGSGNAIEQKGTNAIEVASLNLRNGCALTVRTNTQVNVKSATLSGTLALAGGTFGVASRTTPLAAPAQTAFHLDASTNLTFSGAEVTRWDDCSGGNRYAFSYSGFGPTVVSNALNGLPVVDFGAIGSKKFLAWNTNVVIRSLFLVTKVANDYSAPIGSCQPMMGVVSHFTRQVSQIWSPVGQLTVRSGACYLDGELVNPGQFTLTLNSFVVLGQVMEGSSIANAFACEAYLYTDPSTRANRTGGLQLAEVLIYDRKLTERESLDAQAYLNWKWFGRVSPGYAAPGGSMSLASVSSSTSVGQSTLLIGGDAPVSLGQVSGNASVLLNASVPVAVGNVGTLTGKLALTNTVASFSVSGTLSALDVLGTSGVAVASSTPMTVGTVTGTGTLVKSGDGTLTVNSGSGFSGSLQLLGGTLALGSGVTLDVASVSGSDASVSGGAIAAASLNAGREAADVGSLALSNLTLKNGAAVTVNVVGQTCDCTDVSGELSVSGGGTFLMTFSNNTSYAGQYLVMTYGSLDSQSLANLRGWTVAGDIPAKFSRNVLVKDGKVTISLSRRGTVISIM